MFTAEHEDAVHGALAEKDAGVADAYKKFRAAGGTILQWITLLFQYGPQIVAMIEQIIQNLNPPKPPAPPAPPTH